MAQKFLAFAFLALLAMSLVASDKVKPGQEWDEDSPWIPQWIDCDFNEANANKGPTCLDCHSVVVCTPIGGIVRSCWRPDQPYCNMGECSEEISDVCANSLDVTDDPFALSSSSSEEV